jgi:hypothetical protein
MHWILEYDMGFYEKGDWLPFKKTRRKTFCSWDDGQLGCGVPTILVEGKCRSKFG